MERFYVRVGERQVHVRTTGKGPAVVLLHQSPQSSRELVPLMELLGAHFQVFAPDTPGYGQSDPLSPPDEEAGIDDFVDALAGVFDALGLTRVPLFGTHTGAIQAVRFAARFPHRVHCLVANGVLVNSPEERADLVAHYFTRFEPKWDGSHLAWLWSRLRDQYTFFPWYARTPDSRFSWLASLNEMDAGALEFLQAGDNYRTAYRAVIDYAIADDLARLTVPSYLLVAKPDPLSEAVDSYPTLPHGVTVEVVPQFADIPDATLQFLLQQAPEEAASLGPLSPPTSIGVQRRFLRIASGSVHLRVSGDGEVERPVLCLHEPGTSSRALRELMGAMAPGRQLIAPDLPGHGDTEISGHHSVADIAGFLREVLSALDIDEVDVVTVGASWVYGAALRRELGPRVNGLVLCNPEFVGAYSEQLVQQPIPDLAVDSAGSHLQRAWFYLRDRHLFFPWSERGAENIIHGLVRATPRRLHEQLVDLLKSRDGLQAQLRAAWSVSKEDGLAGLQSEILACDWHPARSEVESCGALPDEPYRWGGAVNDAIARSATR